MLNRTSEEEAVRQRWEEFHSQMPTLVEEFGRGSLGRKSRDKTLARAVKLAEAAPASSLPEMNSSRAGEKPDPKKLAEEPLYASLPAQRLFIGVSRY